MISIARPVFVITFIILFFAGAVYAQNATSNPGPTQLKSPELTSMADVSTGQLMIKSTIPGRYIPAPALATDVKIKVAGTIARTTVTQRFINSTDQWIEAVYAFPLPEGAAVDSLKLRIGDRFIEGQIKEKAEARKIYEQAKASGRKASLVEQHRPNLFTNDVANIGPGETIVVQIEYQQSIRVSDGAYSLRFPTVIGVRYNPSPSHSVEHVDGQTLHVLADPVPDRDKVSPPYAHPKGERINTFTLRVDLDPGLPLAEIETPFHGSTVNQRKDGTYTIELAAPKAPANRDFELVWRPKAGAIPAVSLHAEQLDDDYVLMTITPPDVAPTKPVARELVLVIDTSGSMSGTSIVQARDAALSALDRLRKGDRINVISFNNVTDVLFTRARDVTAESLSQARHYVANLQAGGGTEMMGAMVKALTVDTERKAILRQVVFITDGAIGNEAQLFATIHKMLGRTRLFTVGIGSAPNSYFMTQAATFGRGTFTHIGNVEQVQERMAKLFHKLESPVLTDINITWPTGSGAETWPATVPDLYAGDPIILSAKLSRARGNVKISGKLAGKKWTQKIDLGTASAADGVAKLWARHKIAALENEAIRGADRDDIRDQIVAIGLRHHLVSAHTSLVAVDVTPSRGTDTPIHSTEVPQMLPHGWEWDAVFDAPADTFKTNRAVTGVVAAMAAPAPKQIALPQGATAAQLKLIMGMIMLLLAVVTLLYRRRLMA